MRKIVYSLLLIVLVIPLRAQMITTSPAIPTMGQPVTIYYYSDRDAGELHNYTGDLYAHTGVILVGSTAWTNVIEAWGNNTTQPKFQYLGNYTYMLEITPSIEEFYPDLTEDDVVDKIALVIRNSTGSLQTRPDIFIEIYEVGLNVAITNPLEEVIIIDYNSTFELNASATLADSLVLFINNERILKSGDPLSLTYTVTGDQYGGKWLRVDAYKDPDKASDSLFYFVKKDPVVEDLPVDIVDGINYTSESSATLVLAAPGKSDVFVLGDFNNWEIADEGYMKVTGDGTRFWFELTGLTPGEEYGFQYLVDGTIRIGDPYCEKVLDPWNDSYITETTYPGLMDYPNGLTTGLVSVLQTSAPEYTWTNSTFDKPARGDLVIYELLVRDFVEKHDYKTLIDTIEYLDRMGINAIELMPVNEFDGNINWGYAPSYYLAPDKYYGSKDDLKAFIDTCHGRGIAVILDVVLNHSTGNSPMAALYWNQAENNVTAENPWYNVIAKHDFNVFHDFNHESTYTRAFSKRVMSHWINEYRVDGYRFDLSKGFTQVNTLGNTGLWGQYDASRVAIWKEYADHIWSIDPDFYVILEHFAENTEEKELANYGMMVWGKMWNSYSELSKGYSQSLNWGSYLNRGWNDPHLITYMESHDEERIQVKNLTEGNSSGSYNIRDLNTGLERLILSATMFFTIPGPKMLWQFGELGYDYPIDFNGRTGEKPIKWDYLDIPERLKVYKAYSALINLRTNNEAFSSDDFEITNQGLKHRIKITHPSMDVVVLGNFDVTDGYVEGVFHNTGWWYEYFSGDSINISATNEIIALAKGDYRIYTSERLSKPDLAVSIGDVFRGELDNSWLNIYPNPVGDLLNISFEEHSGETLRGQIVDVAGNILRTFVINPGQDALDVSSLTPGNYFLRLYDKNKIAVKRLIKL